MALHEIVQRARDLLVAQDPGDVGHSEYDAAWIARVPSRNQQGPEFPQVVDAVRRAQSADGGWEAGVRYVSTRIQTTLASCLALLAFPPTRDDLERVRRGIDFVRVAWDCLDRDPEPALGFELVVPSLIEEACARGLELEPLLPDAAKYREQKLSRVPEEAIYSPRLSIGFSLEFLMDSLDPARAEVLRVDNGSLGDSVAATAYFAARTGDEQSYRFLHRIVARHGPDRLPYAEGNLWGTVWVLYNFSIAGILEAVGDLRHRYLDYIRRSVHEEGVSWSSYVQYGDGDDTAVGLYSLQTCGVEVDWRLLQQYEREDGFLTFRAESRPSVSTNANVLFAIQGSSYPERERVCDRLVRLLLSWRNREGYWTDKWHASPLYSSSRAARALIRRGLVGELATTLEWIHATQQADGSWGCFGTGTAEETAYAVQTLVDAAKAGMAVDLDVLGGGLGYLRRQEELGQYHEHPKLWIAKGLYGPTTVVRSTVLSALAMGIPLMEGGAHGG